MGILGAMIAGGAAGGAGSVRKSIEEQREKALLKLQQKHQKSMQNDQFTFTADQNAQDREHQAGMQDDAQAYGSDESQLDREHQTGLQNSRLDLQGWQSGVNDEGDTTFFNLHNDETKTPDGFSFPRAPSSVAFGNTSPGLMVSEWQKQRDYLADRLKDGMVPEGEAAQIKTRIYELESKIAGVLGFDSQDDNVALDLGNSLVGDSASPDKGSAPPPKSGSAPPPKGGASLVNPTTPEAYDQQLNERSAQKAAAEQERATADSQQAERKQVISNVATIIDTITEDPDPATIRKRLIEARQKIADTWSSRDDWSEADLKALQANWSALHELENQFGIPK